MLATVIAIIIEASYQAKKEKNIFGAFSSKEYNKIFMKVLSLQSWIITATQFFP